MRHELYIIAFKTSKLNLEAVAHINDIKFAEIVVEEFMKCI